LFVTARAASDYKREERFLAQWESFLTEPYACRLSADGDRKYFALAIASVSPPRDPPVPKTFLVRALHACWLMVMKARTIAEQTGYLIRPAAVLDEAKAAFRAEYERRQKASKSR
jgi:hypothetical protein